jgi:hypothetical protein
MRTIQNNNNSIEIGSYNYADEENIDKGLICSICLNPFIDPVVYSCGNMFCANCAAAVKSCPLCRKKDCNPAGKVPLFVKNSLDSLKVLCDICKAETARSDLQAHFEQCPQGICYFASI